MRFLQQHQREQYSSGSAALDLWFPTHGEQYSLCCRVGPLDSEKQYSVTAEKEGYILTESKSGSFKAFKLGEVVVKVSGACLNHVTSVETTWRTRHVSLTSCTSPAGSCDSCER